MRKVPLDVALIELITAVHRNLILAAIETEAETGMRLARVSADLRTLRETLHKISDDAIDACLVSTSELILSCSNPSPESARIPETGYA